MFDNEMNKKNKQNELKLKRQLNSTDVHGCDVCSIWFYFGRSGKCNCRYNNSCFFLKSKSK